MGSSRDDVVDEVRANTYRQQAAPAYYAAVGAAPPAHLPAESVEAYRIRLASGLQPFTKTFRTTSTRDLDQMRRAGALHIAEATIYSEAVEHARRPVGPLRETQDPPDRSGRVITRFFGSPEDCWGPFKQQPRSVSRFNTKER